MHGLSHAELAIRDSCRVRLVAVARTSFWKFQPMTTKQTNGPMEPDDRLDLVDEVFTPAKPIRTRALFAGRIEQFNRIYETLLEPGRHAILYGERGVGKTSLANIVREKFVQQNAVVPQVSVDSNDSFTTIWGKVFDRITLSAMKPGVGFLPNRQVELRKLSERLAERSQRALNPDDVADLLSKLPFTVTIIDEFDRLLSEDAALLMADTIKALSDLGTGATVLIVGVARDVTDLIGHHPSIERCVRQIHLQRMAAHELEEILDNGFERLGLHADAEIERRMVNLSHGFPHYTHALGRYSAFDALQSGRDEVTDASFRAAVIEAIADAHESVQRSYLEIMTESVLQALPVLILAAAMADEDQYGTFRLSDVRKSMEAIKKRPLLGWRLQHHLDQLTSEEGGSVLERVGRPGSKRYRFQSPLMRPYIIMQAYKDGTIGDDVLQQLVG
jgi:Cdc6-like AAA superfamily ATPase